MTQQRPAAPSAAAPSPLTTALRAARIEAADRTGVVVDLHDAQLARLEILNEALDPIFAEIPVEVELFDRGLTRGEPPRLWIDMLAHVAMAHDRRVYRFLQDTRHGRRVLAESAEVDVIAAAVTKYVARRLIERERALAADADTGVTAAAGRAEPWPRPAVFLLGAACGVLILFAIAWFAGRPY